MDDNSIPRVMPVFTPQDRSISVPPGHRIATGYVPIENIRLGCRDRMAIGDVESAYRRQLALGSNQAWPCPNGWWEGERFVIADGRHAFVAALMIGLTHLLVAWTEVADERTSFDVQQIIDELDAGTFTEEDFREETDRLAQEDQA